MKSSLFIIGGTLALLSGSALAAETLVIHKERALKYTNYSVSFGINKELGNAYLKFIESQSIDADWIADTYNRKAEGLTYDSASNQVNLKTSDGKTINCGEPRKAYVRTPHTTFEVYSTKGCSLKLKNMKELVDDGTEPNIVQYRTVVLKARN